MLENLGNMKVRMKVGTKYYLHRVPEKQNHLLRKLTSILRSLWSMSYKELLE